MYVVKMQTVQEGYIKKCFPSHQLIIYLFLLLEIFYALKNHIMYVRMFIRRHPLYILGFFFFSLSLKLYVGYVLEVIALIFSMVVQ